MNELERLQARSEQAVRATCVKPTDAVVFRAPCPACGQECDWAAGRVDEHVINVPLCNCGPQDATASSPAA